MPNPLLNIKERFLPGLLRAWRHICWEARGLAHDYWKDGKKSESAPDEIAEEAQAKIKKNPAKAAPAAAPASSIPAVDPRLKQTTGPDGLWHAMPGEISERMWGADYVTPGDEDVTERLIRPLGITKDMSMLDLSAGLGGRLRKTTDEYGVYIHGLEPDPEIAVRGMERSIASGRGKRAIITAYDPMKLAVDRLYDCVLARETIYRVADKAKFIQDIVACCKPKAQVSFTDYIVNPEVRELPAIVAWQAFEKGSNPAGLIEMAELWAKTGFNMRVHEDLTDYYKKEVMAGLTRFAKFMATGIKPDPATKKAIDKRISTWAHRMAAMEQGMKFYRFYGLRG